MAGRIGKLVNRWHLRRVQEHWARQVAVATGIGAPALHRLRTEARAMRRQIDGVLEVADGRLALPAHGAGLPRMPIGTDWVWRPDPWRRPLAEVGMIATGPRTPFGDDLALYHDCPLGEVILRQIRNRQEADRAPYGLVLDTFGFQGSFLSLALGLPDVAITGLTARHLIEVQVLMQCEVILPAFARLNLRNGPNVAQVVSALTAGPAGPALAEFDLAYSGIAQHPVEKVWLDLIFNNPAMTRVNLRDVVVSRRPRAEP